MKKFKMLEAATREEAINSILHTIKENPTFLYRCKSSNFKITKSFESSKGRNYFLSKLVWEQVRDLYIEIKTEYYNSLDYSTKF